MIDDPTVAAAEAPPADDAPPAADADAEPKAPTPPPPPPYQRMSKRVWVVPADATVAAVVEWLDDKHGVATLEKHGVPLSAAGWADSAGGEGAYHAELIEAFKQKGAKPIKAGAKFWKALREAVMERLKTQDLLLLLSDPPPDPQLLKWLWDILDASIILERLNGALRLPPSFPWAPTDCA